MPTMSRPTRAITTVRPANTTELPAVATAVAADSSGIHALAELVSMPAENEERVVDADREADHEREHRGRGRDRREGGDREHGAHRDAERDQRGEQRQAGREQRAEGDDEHEGGEEHAEALDDRDAELDLLEHLAAVLDGEAGSFEGRRRSPARRRASAR